MTIHSQFAERLTIQHYGHHDQIEGVEVIPLALQGDDGGNFSELARVSNGQFEGLTVPFNIRQVSMSLLTPGAIKAYHIHKKQDDVWYAAPSDRLIVNLHDLREGSPTFDMHERFVLGGGKNFLLRIPKGIAHGVANMYERDMTLFYFTDQQFSLQDPDEHRLPWDKFGADVWDITKG